MHGTIVLLIVIGIVLIFLSRKSLIPKLGKSLGEAKREFKKALEEEDNDKNKTEKS